jgi:hypothetical protein
MATRKDYSGALFKNSKKGEGGPNAPDYTGDVLIEGVRYRLAGWVEDSRRGKFLSFAVKRDEEPQEAKSRVRPHDDDMLF